MEMGISLSRGFGQARQTLHEQALAARSACAVVPDIFPFFPRFSFSSLDAFPAKEKGFGQDRF